MKTKWVRILALALLAVLLVPAGMADSLAVSAYAQTPLLSSSAGKIANIDTAAAALSGWIVGQGETFSFNDTVGPRTKENGYLVAENGRGAQVRGGGVAQVATTLYLAVRQLADVTIVEKHTYGKRFSDGYVDNADDAVLTDYAAGTDFRFTNWGEPIEILIWEDGTDVCCSVGPLFDGDGWDTGDMRLVGYAVTWAGDGDARCANIDLAAQAASGASLAPGETFSFNAVVGPRTKEHGYRSAINGRGVRVTGGGVAQLASTIYLAVKDLPQVTVTQKRTYGKSYNQEYVQDPDDAIVTDYSAGTDFAFRYDGSEGLVLFTYIDDSGYLCCEVWEGGSDSDWFWSE